MVMFTFYVLDFFASFIWKICWNFDVTWSISQQFTPWDLKPVALLVLSYKAVLHAFFLLFQAIGYTSINTNILQKHM